MFHIVLISQFSNMYMLLLVVTVISNRVLVVVESKMLQFKLY